MDLDEQANVKKVVDDYGKDGLIVLLGSPNEDAAELFAATVTMGDPTYAGPLAGIPLGLPVYHVLEQEVVEQLPPEIYEEHLAMAAMMLDTPAIVKTVQRIRSEMLASGG
jgi:hypothetical protein